MTGSSDQNEQKTLKPGDGREDEDSDDESEILEESPCGRWVKRREQVRNFLVSISRSAVVNHSCF
jgi:hypothetical protein